MSTQADYKVDKSTWARGPWDTEPDRVDWVHAGLACLALRHPRYGNWCGYAAVPREHPAYGKKAGDVHADAHWGLNYAAPCDGLICHTPQPGMPDDVWWFGFDAGHAFDLCPGFEARERSMGIPLLLPRSPGFPCEVYRTLDYMRQEIEGLAEQLAAMVK